MLETQYNGCYMPSLSNSVPNETMLVLEINHGEHYYFWHVNKCFVLSLGNTELNFFPIPCFLRSYHFNVLDEVTKM